MKLLDRRQRPSVLRPIEELLTPEMLAAWDRDGVGNYRWISDGDNCWCLDRPHSISFLGTTPWNDEPQVTDGHGSMFRWSVRTADPLGGKWVSMNEFARSSYRLKEGGGTEYIIR